MSIGSEKANSFINHLYENPSLQQYTPLQREEQIIQFLEKNQHTLSPTLSSNDFFPGYGWNRIMEMLVSTLQERTNAHFLSDLKELITQSINYGFLRDYGMESVNYDVVQSQIEQLLVKLLQNSGSRRLINGSYNSVFHGMPSRYVTVSFNRKSYLYFEFTKVQHLKIPSDQICDLVKITTLLMPSIWIGDHTGVMVNNSGVPMEVDPPWIERAFERAHSEIGSIPKDILRCALRANLSFTDHSDIEATSRLSAIFVARARYFNPNVAIDRGADTPDKSWFNTARRNHKYYGYDSRMLEELYSISSDNHW